MPNLLELKNVTKVFGGGFLQGSSTLALDRVSITISAERPQITAIAGESGSGKTTLARVLLGVIDPSEGDVLYQGRPLKEMTKRERREFRREVQPIFQDPFGVYNPFYKVDHVLEVPVRKFNLASTRQEARRMIIDALELVGLRPGDTLGRFPHQLSGGQRQRIMVARALVLKPRIILADEPVSMVDASLRATILDSIQKLNRELGIAVIYITHDLTTAYQIADNIMIFYRGSVAEAGDVDHVIKDPKHPYTQLLVESIPQPDPDIRWEESGTVQATMSVAPGMQGCKFAERCPHAMPMCSQQVPPLYRIDPARAASCFLYREHPEHEMDRIGEILTPELANAGSASNAI